MKTKSKNKQGISLIVLVITIIVMIILAAAIILSLSSNGIIDRANEAVYKTDLKQIQTIASLAWSDAYMDGVRSKKGFEAAIKARLKEAGIEENEYELNVTENGVDLEIATTPIYFGKPYSAKQGDNVISYVVYKDGSAQMYMNKVFSDAMPVGTLEYNGREVYMGGQIFVTVEDDGKKFEYMGMIFELDATWCVHDGVEIINETSTYYGDLYCYECGKLITSLEHNSVIPEGGTYYVGVTGKSKGDYTGATATYTAGQNFPDTVTVGDVYIYDGYEYRYWTEEEFYDYQWSLCSKSAPQPGWNIIVIDESKKDYGTINYGVILARINGVQANNMYATFELCNNLSNVKNIIIPNSVTTMVTTFRFCLSLKDVLKIPNSVKNLDSLFLSCGLESVKLPNIKNIAYRMFAGNNDLKDITIPNTVKNIEQEAFNYCTSLNTINYLGTIEQWQAITFDTNWDSFTGEYTIYCTNGTIAKDGTVTYR